MAQGGRGLSCACLCQPPQLVEHRRQRTGAQNPQRLIHCRNECAPKGTWARRLSSLGTDGSAAAPVAASASTVRSRNRTSTVAGRMSTLSGEHCGFGRLCDGSKATLVTGPLPGAALLAQSHRHLHAGCPATGCVHCRRAALTTQANGARTCLGGTRSGGGKAGSWGPLFAACTKIYC